MTSVAAYSRPLLPTTTLQPPILHRQHRLPTHHRPADSRANICSQRCSCAYLTRRHASSPAGTVASSHLFLLSRHTSPTLHQHPAFQLQTMHPSTLLAISALAGPCQASYNLKWNYDASNFFENFDFITVSPPPPSLRRKKEPCNSPTPGRRHLHQRLSKTSASSDVSTRTT